ncbi:MAG: hypothetical protein ACOCZS_02690 [Verrucomicrobiota bacterium]
MQHFIHDKLNQSPRFGPQETNPGNPSPNDKKDVSEVLKKEETIARTNIQQQGRDKIMRQKAGISKRLDELIEECETEKSTIEQNLETFKILKNKIDNLPDQPAEGEEQKWRQVIKEAEMEIFKCEQTVEANTASSGQPSAPDWTSLSFLQLTRAGLGFTWPLIITIAAAVFIFSFVFYSVFAI